MRRIFTKTFLLLFMASLLSHLTKAQEWQHVGLPGISDGNIAYPNIVLDVTNTPYVAYSDYVDGTSFVRVKKYNGTNWMEVGVTGFSSTGGPVSMALDQNGLPLIAYEHYNYPPNGPQNPIIKVKRYTGTNWVDVGAPIIHGSTEYSEGAPGAHWPSLAVDANGTPYVAFYHFDYLENEGRFVNGATVVRFNGSSWGEVGEEAFTRQQPNQLTLALGPNGTPYIAYNQVYDSNGFESRKLSVMTYGGIWGNVGPASFSEGRGYSPSLRIAGDGTPFVAYVDNYPGTNNSTGGKPTVKKYNGSNWVNAGATGLPDGIGNNEVFNISLELDANGTPYIAYDIVDYVVHGRTKVQKLEGSTWVNVGSSFSRANRTKDLGLDSNGNPYVLFMDSENLNKATVMRFVPQVVNTAPVLSSIGNKSGNELSTLSFQASATDDGLPSNTLTFSLAAPATGVYPTGATITAGGAFLWTPTKEQGGKTYRLNIIVSDGELYDEEEIEIQVNKVMGVPVITAMLPVRNERMAALASNVTVLFDQDLSNDAATTEAIKVFSSKAGGKKTGTVTVHQNKLSLNPITDFKPGETVFVTVTTGAQSNDGGTIQVPHVYQFTTAAGVSAGTFSGGSEQTVGKNPYGVEVGDVDGDGDLDFVGANYNYTEDANGVSTASVFINDGTGAFSGHQEVAVGREPQSIALGDLDGDGDLDMLVANYNRLRLSGESTVSVRINDGTGVFSGNQEVQVGLNPTSISLGDIDGDGDVDLLVSSAENFSVSVRINDGKGAFSGNQEVAVGNHPYGVIVGDVDGDGDLDLVSANYSSNSLSIRFNDGTGNFSGSQDIPVVSSFENEYGKVKDISLPIGVEVGDVDGDGDLDLLSANRGTNSISVFVNDGAGRFSQKQVITVEWEPYMVKAGDVDGDGDLDLVSANSSSNSISVRLNDGTGTFSGSQEVAVGNFPFSVTLGDVNGDGGLDFLTANYYSDNVSVRLNKPNNGAPILELIGNKFINELSALTFQASATDDGLPSNTLTFSLAAPATSVYPTGATITAGGAFLWTPTKEQGGKTYRLNIIVSDGELYDEEEIEIEVSEVRDTPVLSASSTCLPDAILSLSNAADASQIVWYKGEEAVNTVTPVPAPEGSPVAGGNGEGTAANQFHQPTGLFVDGSGNIYVADRQNSRIQKWIPGATSGVTVAGGNGQGSAANQLIWPSGVFVDIDGNVYVADRENHRIQKWAPGAISGITVAGGNGQGAAANQLDIPQDVFVDNVGNIFIADVSNHRIQKWAPGATSGVTVAGGNGVGAAANQLNYPQEVFVDGNGNIYIADAGNHRIQKWAPGSMSGTTVAGGSGAAANQHNYVGLDIAKDNNLYVLEYQNALVSKWALPNIATTYAPTIAGTYKASVSYGSETVTTNIVTINEALQVSMSITAAPSTSIQPSTAVTFSATPTNGGENPIYQWKVNEASVGSNSSTFTTSTLANGDIVTCTLTSSADCVSGSPATSNALTIRVNTAPILAPIGNKSISELTNLKFSLLSTDDNFPGTSLIYSLTAAAVGTFPTGATITADNEFSWTPTEAQGPGTYRVKVVVLDGTLSDEEEFEIQVSEVNAAPVLAAIGSKTVETGKTLAFTVTATDADLPALAITYGASPLPSGASFVNTSGVFSWTPANNQAGSYTITFTATDGELTSEEIVSITVTQQQVLSAPKISSFSPSSGPIGTGVTITGSNFTGATEVQFNGVRASYTVVNASTISATVPTGATTGKIRVTNPAGSATSKQNFTVTGSNPPTQPAPSISGFSPTSGAPGTVVAITGTNFTGATAVAFNGTAAAYTVANSTSISATVPLGATSGKISVTTPGGTATSKQNFKVTAMSTASALRAVEEDQALSVYPNPFYGKATVSFVLQSGGEFSAALYDAKGALIAILKEGRAGAGERTMVEIDGSGLAKGLYLVRIQSAEGVQTAKVLLDRK